MAIEIRHLRYVVSVADHGSFTGAAEHLGIAQPALSQQVRKVERELGVDLFARHPRGALTTPAGAAFALDARPAVEAFEAVLAAARRRAAGQVGELVVGYTSGAALELTPLILGAWAERYPDVELRLREHALGDPSAGLADGTSDVAFVRPPLATRGLWFDVLLEEPRVVALAASHPLAGRTSVEVAELLDEPMVGGASSDPVSDGFWFLDDHRDGVPPRLVDDADTFETELQLVAAGRAITVTCASAARFFVRPGVALVPIDGVAPSQLAVAHRAGDPNPLLRNFVELSREVRDRQAAAR